MNRKKWLPASVFLLLVGLGSGLAEADFYVVAKPGFSGVPITSVPFTINAPGFYYLTRNLHCAATEGNAITVDADNVTIDLMGFVLTGPGREVGSTDAIHIGTDRKNIEIRNGTIRGFGGDGIYAVSATQIQRVRNVRVFEIRYMGIRASAVEGCTVSEAGQTAVHVNNVGRVEGNVLVACGLGVRVTGGGLARRNVIAGMTAAGSENYSLHVSHGMVVSENCVTGGNGSAIYSVGTSYLQGNTFAQNVVRNHGYTAFHFDLATDLIDQNAVMGNASTNDTVCVDCIVSNMNIWE